MMAKSCGCCRPRGRGKGVDKGRVGNGGDREGELGPRGSNTSVHRRSPALLFFPHTSITRIPSKIL